MRSELNFESDLPYEILSERVYPWSFAEFENAYVDVAKTLRMAMTTNPTLKVYVANGYYDLATPYFATQYTFNHLGLDASLQANIRMGYFEAGHMMYVHMPSLEKLKGELVDFLGWAGNRSVDPRRVESHGGGGHRADGRLRQFRRLPASGAAAHGHRSAAHPG